MKWTVSKLSIMLAMIFMVSSLKAQLSTYERQPGYWTLGINGGLAYQQSDIPTTLEGFGLGLTLAKNLYYRPGSIFSFDLRGRALYTRTYGLDYDQSFGIQRNEALNGSFDLDYTTEGGGPGFVYQNNLTDHAELGLEGVLNFNRLRERTNVILSLYGGLGIDWYNTRTDQSDLNGIYQEYADINPFASVSSKKSDLRNTILDGDYETDAHGFKDGVGRLGIMPALGIELGYQFTPKFSMGIGHKMTFTNTDIFDGHQWKDNGDLTGDNDIHHYTNLHLRWIIEPAEEKLRPPLVEVTRPNINPSTTSNPNADIRADIKRVNSSMDVEFTLNGFNEGFDFRGEDFSSNVVLRPGKNEMVITARNSAGSDSETVIIYFEEPVIDNPAPNRRPEVQITNPPYEDYRTDVNRFNVQADIRNVYEKRDIRFTVNGRSTTNFQFNGNTNRFEAGIQLEPGRNRIRIEASNNVGTESDESSIILEVIDQTPLPVVEITYPAYSPFETDQQRINLEAEIQNVEDRNDIQYIVDGRTSSDFTYNNGNLRSEINLYADETIVEIRAKNSAGEDSDQVTIIKRDDEPQVRPPVVTITSTSQPTTDPFNPNNCRTTVIATLLNVDNDNDITFLLNGSRLYDFDFNTSSKVLKATVRLQQGFNEIEIRGSNTAGTDQDRVTTEGCSNGQNESKPPVVTITQPSQEVSTQGTPTATIKATILNVERKSDITFEFNGRRTTNFSFNTNSKTLSATVNLRDGNNDVLIEAINSDGSDSDQVRIRFTEPIIEPVNRPTVEITRPANNSTTSVNTTALKAIVKNVDGKDDIKVYVNGNSTRSFSYSSSRKEVTATITLRGGNNTIRVTGTNRTGSADDQVNISYNAPTPVPPVVDITTPSSNNTNTSVAKADVVAKVKNVNSKNDIQVILNGRTFSGFTFSNSLVKMKVNLKKGNNTVVVKASNADGNDQDQVNIKYNPPAPVPPVVNITTPSSNNTSTSVAQANLVAKVKNVTSKNDIQVVVNGRTTAGFTFSNSLVKMTLNLNTGNNTIVVKASNADGNDQDQVSIKFTPPAPVPPIVKITTPLLNNLKVDKASFKIVADVKHVSSKNELTFTLNGKAISNYTLRRGKVVATVTLKQGNNTVKLKATNKDGSDEDSRNITYRPPVKPPVVTITSPKNKAKLTTSKATVKAGITNVSKKADIKLMVNGKSVAFNYSKGKLSGQINLLEGQNRIEVKASNSDGQDAAQVSVTYTPPMPKPTVSITNPAKKGTIVKKAAFDFKAKVKNVTSKADISLQLNKKTVKGFTFNARTGEVRVKVQLKGGNNNFKIKATNASGSSEATTSVKYIAPSISTATPPKVTIVSTSTPTIDPFNPDRAKSTIIAQLDHVGTKKQIVFTLNGQRVSNYSFNTSTGVFKVTVDLNRGENPFSIKATNSDGSDEATRTIVFE